VCSSDLERLEVSIRTKLVNYLSEKYGPFFMHNKGVFKPLISIINPEGTTIEKGFYADLQVSIQRKMNEKHPEVFIKAFKNKYISEPFPPAWMSIEVLTMGELSKLFSNLEPEEDKATIAKYFNLPIPVFDSWLHSLSYVRNLCGHHSRLWNRDLAIDPKKLIEKQGRNKKKWLDGARVDNRRTFYTLCILKFFLDQIIPSNSFKEKFKDLMAKYPDVPVKFLGMPFDGNGDNTNWESLPVWN
jgi:abortive infection bacteriophage resistance protein